MNLIPFISKLMINNLCTGLASPCKLITINFVFLLPLSRVVTSIFLMTFELHR